MKTRDWLAAHDAGKVVHDLSTIEMTDGKGRVCRLPVSADALRVIDAGEKIRRSGGAHASEQMAQRLGGYMLTCKLLEERHINGTVILQPQPSGFIKRGGTINNVTDIEHSRHIDRLVDGCPNFIDWEVAVAQCKSGPWIISNLGKQFALNHECTEHEGTNYGWFVHKSAVRMRGGKWYWVNANGQTILRVHPCDWSKDWFCVQPAAQAHGFGEDADQDDYSQFILLAGGEAWVSDGGIVPTERLYTDPELSVFATFDGKPLRWARHPGVPLIIPAREEREMELPPDTDPAPAPSFSGSGDPELMWGARMVEWMEEHREAKTREIPDGSNNGPEIKVWLGRSIRERVGKAFGPWLAKTGGHWCAASASGGAAFETRMAGDGPWPFLARASGFELEQDAKANDVWWAVEALLDGSVELEPGDVCILPRGKPGGWQRHVCLFVRYINRHSNPPMIETIGGNERNRFQLTTRRLTDLLGAIPMPDGEIERPPATSATTVLVMPELVIEARAELEAADPTDDGDNVLQHRWDKISPHPWQLHEPHGVRGHARRWWSEEAWGIHVIGEAWARRTKGKPITLGKIVNRYGDHIKEASSRTGVPVRLLAAMVTTEGGLLEPKLLERHEERLNDWSFGVAQTLTETAWTMALRLNVKQPDKPIPRGGDVQAWREFLSDPRISILLGAMFLAYNDERWGLGWDPVLAYAGYNAGSPLVRLDKRWGLAHYIYDRDKDGVPEYDAIDTFAAWYGDACAVYSSRASVNSRG